MNQWWLGTQPPKPPMLGSYLQTAARPQRLQWPCFWRGDNARWTISLLSGRFPPHLLEAWQRWSFALRRNQTIDETMLDSSRERNWVKVREDKIKADHGGSFPCAVWNCFTTILCISIPRVGHDYSLVAVPRYAFCVQLREAMVMIRWLKFFLNWHLWLVGYVANLDCVACCTMAILPWMECSHKGQHHN